MKILYVITKADRGGAQVHLLDLLRTLPAGYQAVIATGERGFLTQEAAKLGIPVRLLPDLVQPISPYKDTLALLALIKVIRLEDPDLIHVHTSKAALLGRLGALLTQRTAVFTAHTWSFSDGVSWLQKFIAVPLERLAALGCGKIINVSQANVALALRRSITDSSRMVCIWNGVPDVAARAKPGARAVTRIVMTARFVEQKDHALLIEALSGVAGEWRVMLAGDGPTRPAVEASVKRLGLSDRVLFVGERRDIPEMLAGADIFVLASKWEGLPLSILEAMRAGLPVIASEVGGVAEAVQHGVTGYLAPAGNLEFLRQSIQQLVSSRELQREMGSAGRGRYEVNFRVEAMTQKTLAVYDEVVAKPRVTLAGAQVNGYKVP